MIEAKNLEKRYGEHLALDNLNFSIEKDKVYGLLGANGAGKSTTMNIITGYIGATSGSIEVDGKNVLFSPEEVKKQIGYLPETPPLYLDMKVDEYLYFAAELKEIPKSKRRNHIDEIIQKVKLEEVRHRLIKNLSKGFKQRVGLGQAILGWPKIIILDEPTVGLDPQQIIEIRKLIRELAADHTVILSSHILAEVQEVCDKILIISNGKLIADETTENIGKLLKAPKHLKLIVRAEEKEIQYTLSEIHSIVDYRLEENGDDKHISIQAKKDTDIREEVFFAFAKNNIAILEMTQGSTNLEDVFLELIRDNNNSEKEIAIKEGNTDASDL